MLFCVTFLSTGGIIIIIIIIIIKRKKKFCRQRKKKLQQASYVDTVLEFYVPTKSYVDTV
jgi:hypothetical protein